jgi:predicted nucleotidyltransferase
MKTMQATQLRQNLYDTLTQLEESGEPVEILRHGRPIAKLCVAPNIPAGKRKPLIDLDAIATFCQRHDVKSFAFFGSILTPDFDEQSDVDVLLGVEGRRLSYHEECRMIEELEALFARPVDILTDTVLSSPEMNKHRRESIQSSSKVIYDAAL